MLRRHQILQCTMVSSQREISSSEIREINLKMTYWLNNSQPLQFCGWISRFSVQELSRVKGHWQLYVVSDNRWHTTDDVDIWRRPALLTSEYTHHRLLECSRCIPEPKWHSTKLILTPRCDKVFCGHLLDLFQFDRSPYTNQFWTKRTLLPVDQLFLQPRAYRSPVVTVLSRLKSMHILNIPSFFFTGTTGLDQELSDISITPLRTEPKWPRKDRYLWLSLDVVSHAIPEL